MSREAEVVIAILAAHDTRTQNVEGDWLCACGSFLCPPNDDRLDNCHREHIATIITRRAFGPVDPQLIRDIPPGPPPPYMDTPSHLQTRILPPAEGDA